MHQHQMQAAITQVSVRRQALAAHVAPAACHHCHDALEAPLRSSPARWCYCQRSVTLFWGCGFPSINLLLTKVLCPNTLHILVAQLEQHPGHEGCQTNMRDSNCRCLPLQYRAACAARSNKACSDKARTQEGGGSRGREPPPGAAPSPLPRPGISCCLT